MADLLALGRCNADDEAELFTMAYLAIRTSNVVSGVSALHEQVSKTIFQPLFPGWPTAEIPVSHVTNGIHVPSWDSAPADALWTRAAGKDRWLADLEGLSARIRGVDLESIWQLRTQARHKLVEQIRSQYARQIIEDGASESAVEHATVMFDPAFLTLGFARRFAAYKRPNLLLHDPARLERILTNGQFPVQLILAGKAHPQDLDGQAMIRKWIEFARRPSVRSRVMFLRDYDMLQAQRLVQGIDVWINTPARPWEACGTSGMKVLANGGLNLSERDGWWAEAHAPDIGWAIGDGQDHGNDPTIDPIEAETLYGLLEQEIIPEFYDRAASGLPVRWTTRIRESMGRLAPQFSANRAVREYVEQFYLPAAAAFRARGANAGAEARALQDWLAMLHKSWTQLRFGPVTIIPRQDGCQISVQVALGDLPADAIAVELYADAVTGVTPCRVAMARENRIGEMAVYGATIRGDRPVSDYTPRITPTHRAISDLLEIANILWHH